MADNFETRGLSAMGATFAERKAVREAAEAEAVKDSTAKAVDAEETENKAVKSASTKKRAARKKS